MAGSLRPAAAAAVQSARPSAQERRPPLRSRWPPLFLVPRCRPAVQLRLFRDAGPLARRRATRQEAAPRRQAPDPAARPRPRHRVGLGRPRPLSRRNRRRACDRRNPVGGAVQGVAGPRRRKGHDQQVEFRLQDYRDLDNRYDRIVSVGMFEHVSVNHYAAFFGKCAELLEDDGVMLLHSIGRSEGPNATNPFIAKYIFPGGYIPAPSEVLAAVERAGLLATDIEVLRLHYAETLKAWRARFLAHREQVERLYDQRFLRMWEFYLAASEMSFRHSGLMVMQLQLAKREGPVPITRDYIAREEARLRVLEGGTRPPLRLAGE